MYSFKKSISIFSIFLAGLLLVCSCGCDREEPAETPERDITIEAGVGSSIERFLPGEPVPFGIHVMSSVNASISHFPPEFWIKSLDTGAVICSEEAGNRTWDISPGIPGGYRSKGFWDQKDDEGKQVTIGAYEIGYTWVVVEEETGEEHVITRTAEVNIIDPDSAMNGTLEIFETVTCSGIPVTLERIEMNAVEPTLSILVVPPDYSVPEIDDLEKWGTFTSQSSAEYSIDNAEFQESFKQQSQFAGEGIRITWEIEPVPLDAEVIIYIIT